MIEHTVTFCLKHSPSSPEESNFLAAAAALASLPGVTDFTIRRQTSPKNDHTHGISMSFADAAAFNAYDQHPDHLTFVNTRWLPEVASFQESDFEPLIRKALK
jgi:hypothetical protein